jgi:outer membrane protein assembly factor BamB
MNSQTIAGLIGVLALAGCPRHEGSADAGTDAGQQQTTCDNHGGCDVNAQCVQRDGGRLCICYPWYAGDGLTCSKTGLQAGSPWPTKGGNIRHTGQSPNVGPQTDHLKWSVPVGQDERILSLVLDANGNVYVGAPGIFRALDSHRNFLWDFPVDQADWSSAVLASDGTLYVQGGVIADLLYAFDTASKPQNKRVRWSRDIHDEHGNTPCVGADGTVYIASTGGTRNSEPPTIYAFGSASESSDAGYIWALETSTGGYGYHQPAIGADGTIYVSDSSSLNAVDPQGHLKWSTPISGAAGYHAVNTDPVIAPDGTIYIGTSSGLLYAIDPPTGVSKSRQIMGDVVKSLALGADGTLYVGGGVKDKALVALTPCAFWDSGAVIWRTDVTIGADSIVLGADGTIYISSGDLYALNPDGSLKWRTTELRGYLSEPAIAADGTLYIADSTSKLYAFGP